MSLGDRRDFPAAACAVSKTVHEAVWRLTRDHEAATRAGVVALDILAAVGGLLRRWFA